ncbi:hypothetical protein Droror1_Dr00003478 [Drosera rotundifolia]
MMGSSSFLGRFVEALHYYSALFDVLEEGIGGGVAVEIEGFQMSLEQRRFAEDRMMGSSSFFGRFVETLYYYSALFDVLEEGIGGGVAVEIEGFQMSLEQRRSR